MGSGLGEWSWGVVLGSGLGEWSWGVVLGSGLLKELGGGRRRSLFFERFLERYCKSETMVPDSTQYYQSLVPWPYRVHWKGCRRVMLSNL